MKLIHWIILDAKDTSLVPKPHTGPIWKISNESITNEVHWITIWNYISFPRNFNLITLYECTLKIISDHILISCSINNCRCINSWDTNDPEFKIMHSVKVRHVSFLDKSRHPTKVVISWCCKVWSIMLTVTRTRISEHVIVIVYCMVTIKREFY